MYQKIVCRGGVCKDVTAVEYRLDELYDENEAEQIQMELLKELLGEQP